MSSVLVFAFLGLATPPAGDWVKSFPPAVTSGYVAPSSDVVVVAARNGPETAAATKAIAAAFTSGGRARSVQLGDSLGDVSKLADADIVKKCASLQVTAIVVVRVFSSNDGLRAVVSVLRKSGQELGAFTTTKGKPIPPAPTSTANEGVSAGAAESIQNVAALGTAVAGSKEEEYLDRFVWFGEVLDGSDIPLKNVRPLMGKYRKRLSWSRFYAEVDRPDLRRAYQRNRIVKGSIILASVGAIGAAVAAPWSEDTSTLRSGVAIVGVAGLGAYFWDPQPIRFSEARRLADEHNARVKHELGLSAVSEEAPFVVVIGPHPSGNPIAVVTVTF